MQPPVGPDWRTLACDLAVRRALELAGKRLRTRRSGLLLSSPHPAFPDLDQVPAHELHTHVRVDARRLDKLLDGAWRPLLDALPSGQGIAAVLDAYVRDLLLTGTRHEIRYLTAAIATTSTHQETR